ncbi:MAG: hypothetical protein IT464_00905 [Planctomycetes bacterium]|nr:hypothetical protein [Planctomycetota bacterium]
MTWNARQKYTLTRPRMFACLGLLSVAGLFAPALASQFTLTDTPRRYLIIQMEGANREWEVRPNRITDRSGGNLVGASSDDFLLRVERWDRTGLSRRYNTTLWRAAFARWLGTPAPEGSRFYFYAINPRQPRVDGAGMLNVVDERKRLYWVPPAKVTIKGYPQTWVDIFEGYVNQFSGEERQKAVNDWEAAHRDVIANVDNSETGFSPEERNEFAQFYQAQFVYIRDRNPKLASIYDELANFHRTRNNLDSELATYLSALRAGVVSPDRERFSLAVGRIFVTRLQLYESAIPHLANARNHSEARWLLARCFIELKRFAEARAEITDLVGKLASNELLLETGAEAEQGRAWLTLAELEFSQQDFTAFTSALDKIPQGAPDWAAGRVLYCAMLLHRNLPRRGEEKADHDKIRDIVKTLPWWNEALGYASPGANTVYPLNPLMARALVIYAQTDGQYRMTRPDKPAAPRGDVLAVITAAKNIDPLSAEAWLAEYRLYARIGMFREALAAATAGLDVNPQHTLLNFAAADLNMKAGLHVFAKDYLARCLKHEPDFYPALVMLAEIALADIERIRAALLVRFAAGESVDFAGELTPTMKEAAAFFSAALAIQTRQPATKLALATLYLRLSETAPQAIAVATDRAEVRKAYLSKARDLSRELIDQLTQYADGEKPQTPSEREIADVPSLACYNVYAYAQYSLGFYNDAKQAFLDHLARAVDKRFFSSSTLHQDYQKSVTLAYAKEWLRKIEENQRQYFDVEEFNTDSKDDYFGSWNVPRLPKPDAGFIPNTSIKGGRLKVGIKQAETNIPSRIEIKRPHRTLAAMEAEFVRMGTDNWERGVYIAKYRKPSSGGTPLPLAAMMVGIDSDGRVYWETREFKTDNAAEPEKRKQFGYVDVGDYGGVPLNLEQPLVLGIRRQLADDGSDVQYFALINGFEVKLPMDRTDAMARNDFKNNDLEATAGFYVNAFRGSQASVEIERVKFIFDSGLGERRRN